MDGGDVMTGNWLVRRAVGGKPAILGKKLALYYYKSNDTTTDNYFEVDVDVGMFIYLCTSYSLLTPCSSCMSMHACIHLSVCSLSHRLSQM